MVFRARFPHILRRVKIFSLFLENPEYNVKRERRGKRKMSAMVCCTQRRHAKKKAHSTNILQITYTLASCSWEKESKVVVYKNYSSKYQTCFYFVCLDTRHIMTKQEDITRPFNIFLNLNEYTCCWCWIFLCDVEIFIYGLKKKKKRERRRNLNFWITWFFVSHRCSVRSVRKKIILFVENVEFVSIQQQQY
jgi:hypothetical protein